MGSNTNNVSDNESNAQPTPLARGSTHGAATKTKSAIAPDANRGAKELSAGDPGIASPPNSESPTSTLEETADADEAYGHKARKLGKKTKRPPSPDWPTSPFGLTYELEVLDRVRSLTNLYDTKSNRYGLTRIPKGATWGEAEEKLDDVLCADGRPVIALVIGEIDNASFFDEIGQPLKFVRVSVQPMYHADVVMAHKMIKQLAGKVKKEDELKVGVVEAGRRQARREKKGRNTVPYEFKHGYDASDQYGPKSIMPRLRAQEIGHRDLVIVECKVVRFRVDSETGKANYFNSNWTSWRVRFDIVSVCRLSECGDDIESAEPSDDEDIPVV